jgi:acetyl esterase/lipase
VLHGGFWRLPFGRDQLHAVALDLARRGFAVWNLEYRRLGTPTAGWPGTFDDVTAGIEHLSRLAADGIELDLDRVAVVGHSAGGHLALWSAACQRADRKNGVARRVRIGAVVGQAPVADLVQAHALALGDGAVAELLGGTPAERPAQYQAASPHLMLPFDVPQLVIHGGKDDAVPLEVARSYTRAARAAGDQIELLELPDAGHMDFLDPMSDAHAALCHWLARSPCKAVNVETQPPPLRMPVSGTPAADAPVAPLPGIAGR